MSGEELLKLLPLTAIAVTALLVLTQVCIRRNDGVAAVLTVAGLAVAFGLLFFSDSRDVENVTPLIVLDRYALFFGGLIIAATAAVAVLSHRYFRDVAPNHEEFFILLLLACLGASVLVASSHFASLFLGLEVLSVSLYGLISYPRRQFDSIEAAMKYVILAGTSSAFLLFGIALVYTELGTLEFDLLTSQRETLTTVREPILVAGLGLVVVGLGFKLAVVPFHMWTPDIYQGAPVPVAAFVATVSKAAVFALLLRLFRAVEYDDFDALVWTFWAIAAASMIAGNLLALMQTNFMRLLAYSSIAHMGYLLVAFLADESLVETAVGFYLALYVITTLAAFGVIAVLSTAADEAEELRNLRGLFWSQPVLALILTLSMLSLGGIPFTGGFIAKFYIVASGAESALWALVVILVLTSVIGLFYYLRVIAALYSREEALPKPEVIRGWPGQVVAGGLAIGLIVLGVYPRPFIDLVETMARLN